MIWTKIFRTGIYCLLFSGLSTMLNTCSSKDKKTAVSRERTVTDALGRAVPLPDTVRNIYPLRAGALRLICYLHAAEKVSHVELNERKRSVPYLMANPFLKDLPILGVGNNVEPEILAVSTVDLVIATYMTQTEADALQKKSGKPVFVLSYGDLVDRKQDFYQGLHSLGTLLNKSARADSLVQFIENNLAEAGKRMLSSNKNQLPTAYIGGIAFNGAQGITSTRVQYPPFTYLSINSPVDQVISSKDAIGNGQKNTLLDAEQILAWNPDYIFLDAAGKNIWKEELKRPRYQVLSALQKGSVYTVLPFNWHTINYENLLCNGWFIGKTIYPEGFADVEAEKKSREILQFFYGVDIYEEVSNAYQPFQSYSNEP